MTFPAQSPSPLSRVGLGSTEKVFPGINLEETSNVDYFLWDILQCLQF